MTLLRPSTLHNASLPDKDRQPAVFAAADPCPSWAQDPMRCFRLNSTELINVPRDAAAMRWQRPGFLTYDGSVPVWIGASERLDPLIDVAALSTFAHRLIAFINATDAMTASQQRGPELAVEVAIELGTALNALRKVAPSGGELYLCTADGTVIAGSKWTPEATAMYDPEEGMMIYPRLWDLGLPWASALSKDMVAGKRQAEAWSDTDIVVSRPVAVGDREGASYRLGLEDLRIVSVAPRTVGVSEDF